MEFSDTLRNFVMSTLERQMLVLKDWKFEEGLLAGDCLLKRLLFENNSQLLLFLFELKVR